MSMFVVRVQVSRRNLWNTLINTMASRSVVLTTHSMEEAEALCTRIGIMVKGQLHALGTPQHLKQKFGSEYLVEVTLGPARGAATNDPERAARIGATLLEAFPGATLLSDKGGLLAFRVPRGSFRVGAAFEALEERKEILGITDYAVAEPTLEQVFVRVVTEVTSLAEASRAAASRGGGGDGDEPRTTGTLSPGTASSAAQGNSAASNVATRRDGSDLDTGIRKTWLGLDRRALRSVALYMGLFCLACYIAIVGFDMGFVFFPFVAALFFCILGCLGCCCVLPSDPDDADND